MMNQTGRVGAELVFPTNDPSPFVQGALQVQNCGLNCVIVEEALRFLLSMGGIRENLTVLLKKLAQPDFVLLTQQIIKTKEDFIRFYFKVEFEIKVSPCNGDASKCKWYHVADES